MKETCNWSRMLSPGKHSVSSFGAGVTGVSLFTLEVSIGECFDTPVLPFLTNRFLVRQPDLLLVAVY
jgi:hypothetical protein